MSRIFLTPLCIQFATQVFFLFQNTWFQGHEGERFSSIAVPWSLVGWLLFFEDKGNKQWWYNKDDAGHTIWGEKDGYDGMRVTKDETKFWIWSILDVFCGNMLPF